MKRRRPPRRQTTSAAPPEEESFLPSAVTYASLELGEPNEDVVEAMVEIIHVALRRVTTEAAE